MKLLSITAKNYRTLEDINLSFSRSYCTISGKNNAGKSCVIRLLSALFRKGNSFPWLSEDFRFVFKEDITQWVKQQGALEINYMLELTREDDPALISFIEKMVATAISTSTVSLGVVYTVSESDELKIAITVNKSSADEKSSKEIDKKIKDSNLLFLYNSTTRHEEFYYGRGRRRMFYEFVMSEDEKKEIDEAGKSIELRLRRLAREHKAGLDNILGRLSERYDVEFSPPEGYSTRHMPLGISLRDKHVKVPLIDWGSGTQNRTQILMAVLQANRIRTTESSDDKTTPIVVIEEPESFLHPSAQSEFGRILRTLSADFGIQTIVTTHSPYMLNQEEPASNILLCREVKRGKASQTCVVDTSGANWMAPFAEHLGIAPEEFSCWRPVFSAYKSKVLLVEGPIDKEYFEFFQKQKLAVEGLAKDIEIVPYGGKDTLKNILLVQFVLSKFDHVFITYDLDADKEIRGALNRLGLKERNDFFALGLGQSGKDSIEGLLPERILSAVNGRETDLVMSLRSQNNTERRQAKDKLKKKYLEEFRLHTDYSKEDLKELGKALKIINARFSRPNKTPQRTANRRR
jgi:putative ATP-dependent endonuclease of OLD family